MPDWIDVEAPRALARLWPRLRQDLPEDAATNRLGERLERRFADLLRALHELYGWRYDFFWHVEQVLRAAIEGHVGRKAALRDLDRRREADEGWFLSHKQLGAVFYVDLFAGDLAGVHEKLPYLQELGVTYLHLMPLFARPEPPNDGGYAVSSYRAVHPPLGTLADLKHLADALRERGIALVLDFILNHTADDHPWAEAAKRGDPEYQAYYLMFDDRALPDQYQPHLRAIFPDRGQDAFTWRDDVGPQGKWVWTTFYRFQWDLNYANPELLTAILREMLHLANCGVEVLRLDAVPFLWKQLGTNCENLPQAHTVVRALNALTDIAAPALLFKSEAIVHPDEVARYVNIGECHLSYNPLLMVLLWEALATRDTRLLRHSLRKRFATEAGTAWVNYVRCHDDIGWGFADEDCHEIGIDPQGHRAFLNAFYTGRFPGSFASGLPFQENPLNGDCRIAGMAASLCGLERALERGDASEIDRAVKRILLIHGLIVLIGGVPLLYLGDDIAQLNDTGFRADPDKAADNRWVHRPAYDWTRLAEAQARPETAHGRVYQGLRALIALRHKDACFAGSEMTVLPLASPHLVALRRHGAGGQARLVLGNFSEHRISVAPDEWRSVSAGRARDLYTGHAVDLTQRIALEPYQLSVLALT